LKKRLQRAGELEKRAVSTSPTSSNAHLGGTQSSPGPLNRSLSTGPSVNPNLHTQQQAPLFQELFPEQYLSVHDSHFPTVSEGYMKQPMTSTSDPFSYSGYTQPVPASYAPYNQTTSYADLPSLPMPFNNSTRHRQYTAEDSPMITPSGVPITPITPTSQGDCYTSSDGSAYGMDFAQTYDNLQVPATQAYTDSAAPVNISDFFRQN
jgi:hypothetical protein